MARTTPSFTILGGVNMVVKLKEYESAVEIAKAMDEDISKTKSILGEYLRRLDSIRNLAERSKKIREVVFKLAGKKSAQNSLGEITVGDLSVILDANPFHELTAIEQVVRSQQDRLLVLQKAREALNWVDQIGDTEGLKYLVLENDGVPERILLKIS
jgi:cell division protein FtsX